MPARHCRRPHAHERSTLTIPPDLDIARSVSVGFIYPICGEMRTMPGLGSSPAATRIDLEDGQVVGLS